MRMLSKDNTPFMFRKYHLLVAILACNMFVSLSEISAEDEDGTKQGRKWALLISAEKYHRAPVLRYTVNDVVRLSETLKLYGGISKKSILEITDTQTNPRFQPLRSSLMTELPEFLKKMGPDDDLIVYFSGHGFRDKKGKLYLAPIDIDPASPASTGVSIEWFRGQIAGCKAKFKLLIIDACHAGSEKGEEDSSGITSNDLGATFKDLAGVVTLASSKSTEKSQLWDDKEHSLFTYWLIQALKGNADNDSNGEVDIDELNKYLHRNVTRTAELHFPRLQTPVRIVRPGTPGVPSVIHLRAQGLKRVITDMAEEISLAMLDSKQKRVGIAEFTADSQYEELLGAEFGLLGRYCAKELERQLLDICSGKFSVVDHRRLQGELAKNGYSIDDLHRDDPLTKVSSKTGGMTVIALGTLSNRQGRKITLRCRLTKIDGAEVVASAGGTAKLNISEWGMLGKNAQIKPNDSPPVALSSNVNFSVQDQIDDKIVENLDKRSEGPHPLLQKNFPFPIQIRVNKKVRQFLVHGNELLVPLRKGENYDVVINNLSGKTVMLRLLVDGLNTLPEKVGTNGIDLSKVPSTDKWRFHKKSTTKGIDLFEVAPRVNLDQARPWVLDPKERTRWVISGFATNTGVQGTTRKFHVVSADKSLAARKNFTEGTGLITFGFYSAKSGEPGGSRGNLGTDLGEEISEDLTERSGVTVGDPLALFHVRYVDASTLQDVGP
jgi:Caspase domain